MTVHCPACGFNNAETTPACCECGTTLLRYCGVCGFENPLRDQILWWVRDCPWGVSANNGTDCNRGREH